MSSLHEITLRLRDELREVAFAHPVAYVYRPLDYAWRPHSELLDRYGSGKKSTVLVGMNPGPWGMAQTGVPFGAVSVVSDWLKLEHQSVGRPVPEHPKRPVLGFACPREEVSGARLWGWAREHWGSPEAFFSDRWVTNYCPLLFLDDGGRNLTPERLQRSDRDAITGSCDRALRNIVVTLGATKVVGVGAFAEGRIRKACAPLPIEIGRILHPSPASPAANRGWAAVATEQLRALGLQVPRRASSTSLSGEEI